ncbi:MAG: c-type cytochrome [SAR324 cluster bacterium]|nr:c-type cytochrome [SAR324 cluster bacterium]
MRKTLFKSLSLVGFLVMFIAPTQVFAVNGKQLYNDKLCSGCHGKDGKTSSPQFPHLAGQNQQYLENQFKAIVSGKRKLGSSVLMKNHPKLQNFKEGDIQAITNYLSTLPRAIQTTKAAPSAIAAGEKVYAKIGCKQCHGVAGKGMPAGSPKKYNAYPKLNGQHAIYIYSQLEHILAGTRVNDNAGIMLKQLKKAKLSKADLKSLAAYLSAQN